MSAFRIDVYSVGNVKTNGMTTSISQVRYSIKANKVGALSFVVSTLEYIGAGMGSRKWYYLYHRRFGLIGRFRHLNEDFDENAETVTVTCEDALASLIDVSLDFNMSSVSGTVLAELNRVLGRAGWSATLANATSEFFDVALDYQGINIMQALDSLRQMQRGFFTLSGTNSIRFGRWTDALRDSSAYTLITNASANGTGPAITSLVVVGTSAQIVNRMIPRGQGIGTTQVDLSKSTRTSPYAIASRANWDGGNTDGATPSAALTRTYYIEDAGSIAANGVVERVAVFSDIRPITNSLADQRNAANALYDVASAYMQQYKNPTTEYRVSVAGTQSLLRAGDVVMLDYRGVSETATGRKSRVFLDKKRFFVVEANHDFDDATGEPTTTLTLAENGAKLADVTDVFTNLLADLDKFKLRPAPSIAPLEDNGPTKPIKNGVAWRHPFKIGADVLDVNECKFVFDVTPLIVTATTTTSAPSSTQASSSGGESTQTSSSGGGGTTTSAPTQTGYSTATLTSVPYILDGITQLTKTYPANIGNTGGVAGTSGVYGSFTEFQQHWHTPGDHQHPIETHWHQIYLIPHTHTITIPAHTHTVSVPAHTHTITIPAHNHDIIFGVVEDTNIPTGVSVWFNNTQITPIKNHENGQFAGNTISAVGTYYVDLIPALQAIQSGMQGNHVIEVRCTGGQGMIYGKAKGRVTIQPIRVVD